MSNPANLPQVEKIAFNTRCMELARHNGMDIDLRVPPFDNPMTRCIWRVPPQFTPIVGKELVIVEWGDDC